MNRKILRINGTNARTADVQEKYTPVVKRRQENTVTRNANIAGLAKNVLRKCKNHDMIPFVKSVGVLACLVVLKSPDKQKVNTHARNVESEYTCKICREQNL